MPQSFLGLLIRSLKSAESHFEEPMGKLCANSSNGFSGGQAGRYLGEAVQSAI
jgi:hypothetical protein